MNYLKLLFLVLAGWLLASCSPSQRTKVTVPNPDFNCSFSQPPFLSPNIIQDLVTGLSDEGDQVVAINVLEAQDSNRYFGELTIQKVEKQPYPWIGIRSVNDGETSYFGYRLVGKTTSGVYVLLTSERGGGSGSWPNLMLVTFEYDKAVNCDWEKNKISPAKTRLLIKKVGQIPLGDRWAGTLEVRGNEILIGKDQGWFAGTKGGGGLSENPKDRVIRVEVE